MTFLVEVRTTRGRLRWLGRHGIVWDHHHARHFPTRHVAEVVADHSPLRSRCTEVRVVADHAGVAS